MQSIKAVAFDAYGTLFDVHSVTAKTERLFPGHGKRISEIWRQKQLEYTWLRSLMGRYIDFWRVTDDALKYALKTLRLQANDRTRIVLLQEYLVLKPFPEVFSVLQQLKPVTTLAILSNGTPQMLNSIVNDAGLGPFFSAVLSADAIKIYKPYMGVYQLLPANLGFRKEEILFVSANSWDAAGAKAFGLAVCWVNRSNMPFDELDVTPDLVVNNLEQLKNILLR
ncbi:haloacid dehalogenase type II [Paenibacillus alkalitolerans]|uniref:haloacid dehalogenase type II n=1 Tax=Paenibacillus alkalitolerans TaxID=2799335 RepID=UPI0018F720D2|nr:haloacid dehalogenase type II [Paenibacillus alkalitolerans]